VLTGDEIGKPRTPSELREFIARVTEWALADEDETDEGILKQGVYKRYVDEVLPLNVFADLEYSDDYLIQPVKGNQGYDANVLNLSGELVERVKITVSHDGMASIADAQLLVERGFGNASQFGDSSTQVEQLKPHIRAAAVKKSLADYSDCVLVIVADLVFLPPELRANQDAAIEDVADELRALSFKAKRVRLLVPPDRIIAIAG